jgi:hypothetical protein
LNCDAPKCTEKHDFPLSIGTLLALNFAQSWLLRHGFLIPVPMSANDGNIFFGATAVAIAAMLH